MQNSNPAVSVVIPAFNPGAYLLPAVQSILSQTFQDFELIVIDDGSTDGSFAALKQIEDKRLRIERNPGNLGLVATRNKGISLSRAPLMAILDSDDIAKPERLEKQVARFNAEPELALLGTWADIIDDQGKEFNHIDISANTHEEICRKIFTSNQFVQSSVMLRVDAARAVGGYPSSPDVAEDYALWLRLIENYRVANLPDRLVQYRIHGAQISQRKIKKMREASNQVRFEAWHRCVASQKTDGFYPPQIASRWQRLIGGPNTIGADFYSWAFLYRVADQRLPCLNSVMNGLAAAPLSGRLWGLIIPTKFNIFYWWHRLNGKINTKGS